MFLFFHRFELINVNITEKPDWLFDKNPFGLTPILQYNDKVKVYFSIDYIIMIILREFLNVKNFIIFKKLALLVSI